VVLARLGHPARAVELAEHVLAERWQRLAPDRQGLTLDKLSRTTGESALHEHVVEAARLLADRADTPTRDQAGVACGMRTGLARCAVDRTAQPAVPTALNEEA
jgi:hypothetical protein